MKRSSNFISALLGLLLLIALGIGLAAVLRGVSSTAGGPNVSPLATTVVLQSPLNTPTLVNTPSPVPTATPMVIPPPPDWPTGQPWPPPTRSSQQQKPTPFPTIFPTPAFQPPPKGTPPNSLQTIWYPYFPDSNSEPQLRAVLVDSTGQRWDETKQSIDLGLRAQFPGPTLMDIFPSPNHDLLIADVAYGDSMKSTVMDLHARTYDTLTSDGKPATFLAWKPDSQHVLMASDSGALLSDPSSTVSVTVDFPKDQYGPYLNAAAYSPDGSKLADAVVYPAVSGVRTVEVAEVALRNGEHAKRRSIIQIPGGVLIGFHSLAWSSAGANLSWVTNVVPTNTVSVANMQTQLWILDTTTEEARAVATLAQGTEYKQVPVWSPDGNYIAFVREDISGDNVYLFDIRAGVEKQLTYLNGRRLSHLEWSPDGKLLAFNLSVGDHGEIWITDLSGENRRPVAGPVPNDAPFVWLP